jgi:hypothetical protein
VSGKDEYNMEQYVAGSVLEEKSSISEICPSLYIGDVEIAIDRFCDDEVDSVEICVLDHNVVPSSL